MTKEPPIASSLIGELASRIRAWRQQGYERPTEVEAADYVEFITSGLQQRSPDSELIDEMETFKAEAQGRYYHVPTVERCIAIVRQHYGSGDANGILSREEDRPKPCPASATIIDCLNRIQATLKAYQEVDDGAVKFLDGLKATPETVDSDSLARAALADLAVVRGYLRSERRAEKGTGAQGAFV